MYAIYTFERFKRQFAVRVATDYLGVLSMLDQVRNSEQNYRGLISSTRRARRMSSAGRLPEIQVDQSLQDELRARNRWILALQGYDRDLDDFKIFLGLPTDALVSLDDSELKKLADVVKLTETVEEEEKVPPNADDKIVLEPPTNRDAGPYEIPEDEAIAIAFENRLDLRIALGQIFDSQRGVMVAADALRADLTLLGSVIAGERRTLAGTDRSDTGLRLDRARYSAFLSIDLPLERVPERNFYRSSLIAFERSVRAMQDLEDTIKGDIRDDLRTLLAARESLRIQKEAVAVALRRVESTELFLRAGRAEIRDVLEAQEDLISAQNALTASRVQYRVSELDLQRDLDVLEVDHQGLWQEFRPEMNKP